MRRRVCGWRLLRRVGWVNSRRVESLIHGMTFVCTVLWIVLTSICHRLHTQVKQADAPAFSFLQPSDPLHAYYCHMRDEEREPEEDYTMDAEAKAKARGTVILRTLVDGSIHDA